MAESLKNEEKECIDCYINEYGFCNREIVSKDIIKECQKLDICSHRNLIKILSKILPVFIQKLSSILFWE